MCMFGDLMCTKYWPEFYFAVSSHSRKIAKINSPRKKHLNSILCPTVYGTSLEVSLELLESVGCCG